MSHPHKPKAFWRMARIWFRHVRIIVWLLILLLLLAVMYLHKIGLPGFAQRAVVRAFETRGLVLDFSQLHLAWLQGIVAEDVSLQPADTGWVPRIECRRVDLGFDPLSVFRLKIVPTSLTITDGQLILPYPQTNGLPGWLTATNLQALIRFDPEAGICLDALSGKFVGCNLSAAGTVVNPRLIQDWRILKTRADEHRSPAYEIWQTVSRIRDKVEFLSAPKLHLEFNADGVAPEDLSLQFFLNVDAVASPFGLLDNPEVSARLAPMADGTCSELEVVVQADHVVSPYGRGDQVLLQSTLSCLPEAGRFLAGRATFSSHQLDTVWAGAVDLVSTIGWSGDGTNLMPALAELGLEATELSASFGRAQGVRAELQLAPFAGDHRQILDLPRFLFTTLEPLELDGSFQIDLLETPWLPATNLALAARWSSPTLSLSNLSVDCADGHLDAGATYDAISGRLQFRAFSDFDPKRFYPVLPQEAIDWLDLFTYQQPPVVHGVGAVTLPKWEPHSLRWPGNVVPSLYLNGQFDVGAGTYRRIPLSGAASHFTYSNMIWHLPNLTLRGPDGSLQVEHYNNDRTREFIWRVVGAMDPTPALILVPEDATETRQILETLQFNAPPEVHLEFTGRWDDLQASQAWGTLHATELAFRGESFDELDARLGFTNLSLTVNEFQLKAGSSQASATSLTFDFVQNLAFLSNGVTTLPPMTVATVIGPEVIKAIQPYHFLNPPSGQVEGVIPLKGVAGADLHFNLLGGPFEWWQFHLSELAGRVWWKEETVTLEIPRAGFYGGTAAGGGFFDFTGKKDADFRFNLLVEDADMQPLVTGVFQSTNRLEGRLSGSLSITNANTGDFSTWFGYGHAKLKEGFIWSVPIFGIVSPVLEVFVPGLGNSRASEAEGRYVITNSVIRTEDLVIHTSNMRLLYTGTLDFQGAVDTVAEAEILRDTFMVGELVSLALTPLSKAMIIEITGTLSNPKARPLYLVPRLLLAPLNPVKLFKNMFAPPSAQYEELPTVTPDETKMPPPDTPLVPH